MIKSAALQSFVDLLYPPICGACDIKLMGGESFICTSCRIALPVTDFHLNQKNTMAQRFWGQINSEHHLAYLNYMKGGIAQKLIQQFKYYDGIRLGEMLARNYAALLKDGDWGEKFDLIVPIPLHHRRKKQRGFNQSDVIARVFSEELNIAWQPDVLKRTRANRTQTKNTKEGRWKNSAGLFRLHKGDCTDKRVLVVDDIITSGATFIHAGQALEAGNPASISFLALACAV